MAITLAEAALLSTNDLEFQVLGNLSGDPSTVNSLQDRWSLVATSGKRSWYLTSAGLPDSTIASKADALRLLLDVLSGAGRAWSSGSLSDRWRSYLVWSLTGSLPT